ncbi:MAG: PQQ-like beta-propeller repeat protein [Thermoanaerobaculia bacterium]|nr:PQQ-like beta-propeller repeat protein [Thermoanaerobaculia bacterium]
MFSRPAVAGPVVVVASCDGVVRAFERADGRERWNLDTRGDHAARAGQFHADVVTSGDSILGAATDSVRDGFVYAFSRVSGMVMWKAPMPGGASAIFDAEGSLMALSPSGAIVSFDSTTGQVRWARVRSGRPWQGELMPAAISGNRLLAGSGRRIDALRVSDGSLLWSAPVDELRGLAAEKRDVVVSSASEVRLLDGGDGSCRASAALDNMWGAPLLTELLVLAQLVTDESSELVALDRGTLEAHWKVAMPARISAPRPLASEDAVYVGLDDGRVLEVRLADGATIEVARLEGRVRSISSDGVEALFVGTTSGQFARIVRTSE